MRRRLHPPVASILLLLFTSSVVLATGCDNRAASNSGSDGSTPRADGFVARADSRRATADSTVQHDMVVPGKVTVYTDKSLYAVYNDPPRGTVVNGTNETIYLGGCGVLSNDELINGKWVDHGAGMDCYWEGYAQPLLPGQSRTELLYFGRPGRWRAAVDYGVDCEPKQPLSTAKCKRRERAVSAEARVAATSKDCDEVSKHYAKALANARKCQKVPGPTVCTKTAPQNFLCGCSVPINASSEYMVKKWIDKWKAFECTTLQPPPPCPPFACQVPLPADCVDGKTCSAL